MMCSEVIGQTYCHRQTDGWIDRWTDRWMDTVDGTTHLTVGVTRSNIVDSIYSLILPLISVAIYNTISFIQYKDL